MRSASDFDAHYQSEDPWSLRKARRRDRQLSALVGPFVSGKSVLELGCGEGHLTATLLRSAKSVRGIDISPIAISRADELLLPNACFEVSDFLNVSLAGYDVIAAIECLYYLSSEEQNTFFEKLVREHANGILVFSAPIIGSNEYRTYYTHERIKQIFSRHDISVIKWRNLNAYRRAGIGATIAALATRLPFGGGLVASLPEKWVYQRCYVARCPG